VRVYVRIRDAGTHEEEEDPKKGGCGHDIRPVLYSTFYGAVLITYCSLNESKVSGSPSTLNWSCEI
jgi:hypothetical protein